MWTGTIGGTQSTGLTVDWEPPALRRQHGRPLDADTMHSCTVVERVVEKAETEEGTAAKDAERCAYEQRRMELIEEIRLAVKRLDAAATPTVLEPDLSQISAMLDGDAVAEGTGAEMLVANARRTLKNWKKRRKKKTGETDT